MRSGNNMFRPLFMLHFFTDAFKLYHYQSPYKNLTNVVIHF